ncbi:MAG: hypothetical protein MJ096_03405 [Clostridia bacterium]|nr:hypothetical protein [Clostridia bacterium]
MKYTPDGDGRKAGIISVIAVVLALVLYAFSLSGAVSPLPLQLATFALFIAAAYVLVRYRFTTVTYIVRPHSENVDGYGESIYSLPASMLDFAVVRAQGKREGALECLLSLDLLTGVEKFTDPETVRQKHKGAKIYYYTVSMKKSDCSVLVFDDAGEVSCLVIETDEKMRKFLEDVCAGDPEVDI